MHARLSRFAGLPPERIQEMIRQYEEDYLPTLEQSQGFRGTFFGVDWRAGKATAISLWETLEDLEASDRAADEARAARLETAGPAREPIVDRYEVVLARQPQPR